MGENENLIKESKDLLRSYLPDYENKEKNAVLTKFLCFGCRRIVENSKNPEEFFTFLPKFMMKNLENIDDFYQKNTSLKEEDKIDMFFINENEKK